MSHIGTHTELNISGLGQLNFVVFGRCKVRISPVILCGSDSSQMRARAKEEETVTLLPLTASSAIYFIVYTILGYRSWVGMR